MVRAQCIWQYKYYFKNYFIHFYEFNLRLVSGIQIRNHLPLHCHQLSKIDILMVIDMILQATRTKIYVQHTSLMIMLCPQYWMESYKILGGWFMVNE